MKNCALAVILVVAASVYTEAASDRANEAHQVPSSFRNGVKWELGTETLGPLRFPKPTPIPQIQVEHHTTYRPVTSSPRTGYNYDAPTRYVQQPAQPVYDYVQYPVQQPSLRYIPDSPFGQSEIVETQYEKKCQC